MEMEKEKTDELERIMAMNSYSEWRQMTLAKNASERLLRQIPLDKSIIYGGTPAEQMATITGNLGEIVIAFVISANEYVLDAKLPTPIALPRKPCMEGT